jgi:hypothetical protein
MRVSQIQNLTWAGNVLVLGGVVWVGLQFWQVKNAKPAAEPAWAKAKTEDVGKQRWPGEVSAFEVIYKTPISGKVPPPPQATAPVVKPDRTTEFKNKLKYVTGVEFPNTPERSLARVNFDSKDVWISPGDDLGGFRLIEFRLVAVKAPAGPDGKPVPQEYARIAHMVFLNPDGGDPLVIDQPDPQSKQLLAAGNVPWEPESETPDIKRFRTAEAGPLKQAFRETGGDWIITEDEQLWIEVWGEKDLLPNLAMQPRTDADGNPQGVRITGLPEAKTPLAPSHGIYTEDVVRSINGVAVNSKEEILDYLRGQGKGLSRYEVVVESNGATRTVVYRVPRPVKASRD